MAEFPRSIGKAIGNTSHKSAIQLQPLAEQPALEAAATLSIACPPPQETVVAASPSHYMILHADLAPNTTAKAYLTQPPAGNPALLHW